MAWILITPASRGIGHALTRHLLKTLPASIPIVATTRTSASETKESILSDLSLDSESASRLDIQPVDLLSESSIKDLASYCKDRYHKDSTSSSSSSSSSSSLSKNTTNDNSVPPHLRLAFFVPGMLQPEKSPQQISHDTALSTFTLNTLAPMMLLKHFTPFLPRKKISPLPSHPGLPPSSVLACMSARVGSITDNKLGGWYSYRASKAALNQVVRSVDLYVKVASGDKACVVGLHPGTVKTDLSREFWASTKADKLFSPDFAAERLVEVVTGVVGGDVEGRRGRCWDWKGEEVPP